MVTGSLLMTRVGSTSTRRCSNGAGERPVASIWRSTATTRGLQLRIRRAPPRRTVVSWQGCHPRRGLHPSHQGGNAPLDTALLSL